MSNLRTQYAVAEFHEEYEREERLKNTEAERPLRQLESEQQRLLRELRAFEIEDVKAGKKDPGFRIPQSVLGKQMSEDQANEFNAAEARKFKENTPDFYNSPANIKAICDYLLQQGVLIADAATFTAAYERLTYLGMLEDKPEASPLPQQQAEPEPDRAEVERLRREEYHTKVILTDPRTGEGLTEYKLDLLSADEYRRLMFGEFGVPKVTDVLTNV